MLQKECPSCAMEVPRDAKVCPICGYEFPQGNKFFSLIVILMLILILLYFIFWMKYEDYLLYYHPVIFIFA